MHSDIQDEIQKITQEYIGDFNIEELDEKNSIQELIPESSNLSSNKDNIASNPDTSIQQLASTENTNVSPQEKDTLSQFRRIKKLPPHIVNKIAAGEVIQYPASMAKELLENSLDAGSTRITIRVQNGGLEKFIISDNGHGIAFEDLPLVCERYTTSKLRYLDDLLHIGTYGFRGEALASVSCVANVKIISKTQDQPCAYKAVFVNNKIFPEGEQPSPMAGSNGTTIEVDRLFHDNEIRFQAQKHSQELKRIEDCLRKYALHNYNVQITLKKIVSQRKDELIFTTPAQSDFLKNLRILYGKDIASSVMNVQLSDERYSFKCNAYVSNPQYSSTHSLCIIFINHRLVKCPRLKKEIEMILEPYLPTKKKPFIYLSLSLNPTTVDVNCHPAKEQVGFLNEDEIIGLICDSIKEKLVNSDDSRVLFTQRYLSSNTLSASGGSQLLENLSQNIDKTFNSPSRQTEDSERTYDYNKVRVTSKDIGLDKYLSPFSSIANTSTQFSGAKRALEISSNLEKRRKYDEDDNIEINNDESIILKQENSSNTKSIEENDQSEIETIDDYDEEDEGELESVYILLSEIENGSSRQIQDILKNHVFVGCATPSLVLIQHETNLYSLDPIALSRELFYQVLLRNIKKMGKMKMESSLSLRKILQFSLNDTVVCDTCISLLKKGFVAQLLSSYFSLDIDITPENDAYLLSIPIILNNYIPPLHRLPMLIYKLTHEVNWKDEKECIHGTSLFLSEFYELCREEEIIIYSDDSSFEGTASQSDLMDSNLRRTIIKKGYTEPLLKWVTQHVIFDSIKNTNLFVPPRKFEEAAQIKLVTNLSKLYQVFERC